MTITVSLYGSFVLSSLFKAVSFSETNVINDGEVHNLKETYQLFLANRVTLVQCGGVNWFPLLFNFDRPLSSRFP